MYFLGDWLAILFPTRGKRFFEYRLPACSDGRVVWGIATDCFLSLIIRESIAVVACEKGVSDFMLSGGFVVSPVSSTIPSTG